MNSVCADLGIRADWGNERVSKCGCKVGNFQEPKKRREARRFGGLLAKTSLKVLCSDEIQRKVGPPSRQAKVGKLLFWDDMICAWDTILGLERQRQ
jgi:hypothetical protein